MTDELAGYDYVTKSVIFKKSDGITYQYPLIKLDAAGKMAVLGSSSVWDTSAQWDVQFGRLSVIALLSFLVLLFTWLGLDVGSLWLSATVVAGVPEFVRSLKLWLKFFLLQLVFSFFGGMLGGILGALAGNPQEAAGAGMFVGGILGVIRILATLLIIPGHFEISFFRSLAFLLVYLFTFGVSLVVTMVCFALLMLIEPFGDAVLVHAFMRPFGLV